MNSKLHRFIAATTLGLLAVILLAGGAWPSATARGNEAGFLTYLPLQQHSVVTDRDWDSRLSQRGARLVPAEVAVGQGYWKLVRARWYNTEEAQGTHHIYVDALDETGVRKAGVSVRIAWSTDSIVVTTEAKPGDEYAANYPMYSLAPAYSAQPDDGAPADRVEGMGLGEIHDPYLAYHTSYGLVWRWTLAK